MTYPAYFHPFAFPDGLPLAIVRFSDIGYKNGSTKAMCAALMCPECGSVYHWLAAHECE